jgi:hypothetical protein
MRRSAQFRRERNDEHGGVGMSDVAAALDAMLFRGGPMNAALTRSVRATTARTTSSDACAYHNVARTLCRSPRRLTARTATISCFP